MDHRKKIENKGFWLSLIGSLYNVTFLLKWTAKNFKETTELSWIRPHSATRLGKSETFAALLSYRVHWPFSAIRKNPPPPATKIRHHFIWIKRRERDWISNLVLPCLSPVFHEPYDKRISSYSLTVLCFTRDSHAVSSNTGFYFRCAIVWLCYTSPFPPLPYLA
jgi:hypothetical protein